MKWLSLLVLAVISLQTAWANPAFGNSDERAWNGFSKIQSADVRVNLPEDDMINPVALYKPRSSSNRFRITAFFLFMSVMPACGSLLPMDANERALQGTWGHGHDQGEGHTSYLEWTFDHGHFKVGGYPPLKQTGSYRVVKSEDKTIVLHLYNQSGDWGKDENDIKIVLSSDGKSLTIDGEGPFQQSKPIM